MPTRSPARAAGADGALLEVLAVDLDVDELAPLVVEHRAARDDRSGKVFARRQTHAYEPADPQARIGGMQRIDDVDRTRSSHPRCERR